jgi:hypothetical protein
MPITDATKILFSTSNNVQKILFNDSTTVTVPVDSGSVPIIYTPFTVLVHGLGYIPKGRVFIEYPSGQVWPVQADSNMNPLFGRFYFTTSSLIVELDNFTGSSQNVKIYWRVYAD